MYVLSSRLHSVLMITSLIAASFIGATAVAQSGAAGVIVVEPGEYISKGGWGVLNVKKSADGKLMFGIEAMGGNGHSCTLDGEIRQGVATLDAMEPGKPCVVKFSASPKGVEVTPTTEGMVCQYFCGMRASFDGMYFSVPSGCRTAEVKAARKRFSDAYTKKDYAAARSYLQPVAENCEEFVGIWQAFDIRNDYAVTLYHLKEKAACLKTLEPMVAIAKSTEQYIRDNHAPTDADNMLAVRRAAATNLALCRKLG